jgi:hypothetical protein
MMYSNNAFCHLQQLMENVKPYRKQTRCNLTFFKCLVLIQSTTDMHHMLPVKLP